MKRHIFRGYIRIAMACAMLVSLLAGYALADVIWVPDDDFYYKNADNCEYVNRDYYANGENGRMEVFSEPGGTSLGFAENGGVFHVQFSYAQGDETWGVIEYGKDGNEIVPLSESAESYVGTGWINLSDAAIKFDYISFDDEHSSEYVPYDGDYSELKDVQNIVEWTFPNSGETGGTIDQIDENFQIDNVYTDIAGEKWGNVSYYYGMKNFWVCISDPSNADIAARDVPVPDLNTASPDSKTQTSGTDMTTVIVICVAAVILISVILINVTDRKKRSATNVK